MDARTGAGAVVAVVLLLAVLAFAVVRPRRLPEAVAAVPAAVFVVVSGLVTPDDAAHEIGSLAPTVGFLAAVLLIAHLAREAGVFTWAGSVMARRSGGTATGLLTAVFVVASLTTAALSLDATVVLLTPVVLVTAHRLAVRPRPSLYASTHLANTASLLLPVSNLTNLLAFGATGLSFLTFTGLMAVPWVLAIGVEYVVLRWFFARDLAEPPGPRPAPGPADDAPAPRFALTVLGLTLVGFALAEPLGVPLAAVAAAGALVLAVPALRARGAAELGAMVRAVNVPFLAFVLALGIVVLAVREGPVGDVVARLVPAGPTLLGLLAVAALAAVLANLLNNLPATLVLVPLAAHSPGLVLAVLVGVNIGPNLTYVGSLATLLWREILTRHRRAASTRTFTLLGLATVPPAIVVAVLALWAGLRVAGVG